MVLALALVGKKYRPKKKKKKEKKFFLLGSKKEINLFRFEIFERMNLKKKTKHDKKITKKLFF